MKNIIFLTGYYGSGKTEIAINLALKEKVNYLVDLDIINPYFRSREVSHILGENIEIISSDLKNGVYADLPYISKKVFLPFHNNETKAIYDLGGNDLGAKVLRQFDLKFQDMIDMLFVVNIFRSETKDVENIIKLIHKIEGISGFKITGLINNSNLLNETTYEDIFKGEEVCLEASNILNIPIVYTCIRDSLYNKDIKTIKKPLIIKTYMRKNWY